MGYDNNNKGALFKNDKKESDTHPDYRGTAEIEGIEYWVSSWINTAKSSGKTYMSLAFTRKNEEIKPSSNGNEHQGAPADNDGHQGSPQDDDDIPF